MHARLGLAALLSVVGPLASCGDGGAGEEEDAGADGGVVRTPDEPACAAYVDRQIAACPESQAQRATSLDVCSQEADQAISTGCGDAYGKFLDCAAGAASWDCKTGPSGCSGADNAAYSCATTFKTNTGCTPHGRVTGCGADAPYKFICLQNRAPADGCTLVDDSELYSFCCG